MRRRTCLLTLALLLVAAPAAQAEPRIAPGVAAAGVDVSGLTLPEAANRIAFIHQPKITSPLSTHVAGRAFILRGKDVDFAFDAAKTARRAYNAGVAPHPGPVNVPLYVAFKQSKVDAYVAKIQKTIARAPRDARVDIHLTRMGRVESRDGRTVDAAALKQAVVNT